MLFFKKAVKQAIFSAFALNAIKKSDQKNLICLLEDMNLLHKGMLSSYTQFKIDQTNIPDMTALETKLSKHSFGYTLGKHDPIVMIYPEEQDQIGLRNASFGMWETIERLIALSIEKNGHGDEHVQTLLDQAEKLAGPNKIKFFENCPTLDDCPPLLDPEPQPQSCPTLKI